jgi:hypothetical protein
LHDVLEVGHVRAHLPRDDVLHLHGLLPLVRRRPRSAARPPGGFRGSHWRRPPRSAAAATSRLVFHVGYVVRLG